MELVGEYMAEQYNKSHRRAGHEAKQRGNQYLHQNYNDPAIPRIQKLIEQMLVYLHSVVIIHDIKCGKKKQSTDRKRDKNGND
jgi:hypothetical protein